MELMVVDCGDYNFNITEGVGTFDYTVTPKKEHI